FYSRPENTNINCTFDNNEYNSNEWIMRSRPYMNNYLNGMYVNDGKLVFNNVAGDTSFSTLYKYSDFEFEMDITDIRREPVIDSDGNIIYPVSSWIGFMFGSPLNNENFGNQVGRYPLIGFEAPIDQKTWEREKLDNGKNAPTRMFILGGGLDNGNIPLPSTFDFWEPKFEGTDVKVKIKVVDNLLNIYLSYEGVPETLVYSNTMKTSFEGYVYIYGMGNSYYVPEISLGASCGNFAVDNIKITNLDKDGNIIESEYVSNKGEEPIDYPYVDKNDDEEYLLKEIDGKGCSSNNKTSIIFVFSCVSLIYLAVKINFKGA
ncbi:MAG: hypothetical protein WCR27_07475, partial [Eubacteriales bacterium]